MPKTARFLAVAFLLAMCAQLLFTSPATATAGNVTEYSLPANGQTTTTCSTRHRCTTSTSNWCSCPATIALSPDDGGLWFTETGGKLGHGAIGRISTTGTINEYGLATYGSLPVGIAAGPSGAFALWFTEQSANRIGKITTGGVITEFPLPTAGSQPRGIALGPDGAYWFTESRSSGTMTGFVGRIDQNGGISEFMVPFAYSRPFLITGGPDGNLWFTDEGTNSVGRVTTAGFISEFVLPSTGSGPHGITTGPDGNLWAAEANASKVAVITPGGSITEYPAPGGPAGIATGPDNNIWFTEATNVSGVGTMSTSGNVIASYSLGTTQTKDPQGIIAGPDGRMWFTEEFGGANGAIGAVTTM